MKAVNSNRDEAQLPDVGSVSMARRARVGCEALFVT